MVCFSVEGVTLDTSLLEKDGESGLRDAVDWFMEDIPGRGWSSVEKMERSSPFHRSPQ
jgi:hypothetical protein